MQPAQIACAGCVGPLDSIDTASMPNMAFAGCVEPQVNRNTTVLLAPSTWFAANRAGTRLPARHSSPQRGIDVAIRIVHRSRWIGSDSLGR
jgi:hypothetical protein